uniref:Semaphorin-4E-like n=1 Tax=Stegastes partitus TaxID=144197 RepID=A0A3B4ZXJ5_9TELE
VTYIELSSIKMQGFKSNLQLLVPLSAPDVNLKLFKESGFGSLSSLMVRDDIDQLVLGAKGRVIALSLDDITRKTSEVTAVVWLAAVTSADKALCQMKGKSTEECDNVIRTLHTMSDGKMLVCGTNAFNPAYSVISKSFLLVCSFELMFSFHSPGNTLYSATSSNFLGTAMVFQRHGPNPVKTEMKRSWLNASNNSDNGEDDSVFLFFTEAAVEERRGNIQVSRIGRVCKSDLGGKRTLQKRWTSFLKARLDCPFGDAGSQPLVQDVFLLQDQNNWRGSIFYATFTSNSQSAVCAYKLSDISQVFGGRFLTETDSGSWDIYTGGEPFSYPGSCINDEMRAKGVMSSLDLSDTTLVFVKNHPLMDGVVTPITGKPLLVQTLTRFSKIVVDQVTSLDGQQHQIMLIGTGSGPQTGVYKAVRFDGEDGRIIEELQLFQDPQPVDFLQLSSKTGQLYSGTDDAAVQVDLRDCRRYTSCDDCLLARDPYCGWDKSRGQCASVVGVSTTIQSLSDGDIRMCPPSDLKQTPTVVHFAIGIAQFLPCSPENNLPVSWRFSDSVLHAGPRHTVLSQGLIITPSFSDAGLYTCETVETVKGRVHRTTVIQFLVQLQDTRTVVRNLEAAAITLAAFASLLIMLICGALVIRHLAEKKQGRVGSGNENCDMEGCVHHSGMLAQSEL